MLAMLSLVAALSAGDFCPDCDRNTPDVEPPVIAIKVLAPQKASDTGLIHYRVIATNRSSAKAFEVKVKLDLPAKTTLQSSKPDAEKQQGTLVWNIGTMPGNCQRIIDLALKSEVNGPLETCFRISYEHGVCVTTNSSCKPPTKPGVDESLPIPKAAGQLTVLKLAPARQGMGTPILYSITVTNSGKVPLREVELLDIFPANAVYVQNSADNNGQMQGPESKKMVWRLGTMLPAETRTVTFKVRPTQAGTFLNVANARGLDPDSQTVISKDSTSTTEVSGAATLYMEVKDTVDPLFTGGTTMYSILVRNTGSAPATGIRVVADVPVGMTVTGITPPADADASGFRTGEQRINFAAFALQPGQEKTYQIRVKAEKAALFRFRSTLTADSLDPAKGPLVEEETTTVVNEKPPDSLTKLAVPTVGELAKWVK
ncbi:MAG TPA: hypothetical protein PLN21_15205 [Gemmatales bacterium]|nr:hypothetical protein [Gemmatales bacterium]